MTLHIPYLKSVTQDACDRSTWGMLVTTNLLVTLIPLIVEHYPHVHDTVGYNVVLWAVRLCAPVHIQKFMRLSDINQHFVEN